MNEEAVCGYQLRLEWLHRELLRFLSECRNDEERQQLAAWYMSHGFSIGLKRDDLLSVLLDCPIIASMTVVLSDIDVQKGKHPPEFRIGDLVQVIVNAKNITPHCGVVAEAIWHHAEFKWHYRIRENDKLVGKRYSREDLVKIV